MHMAAKTLTKRKLGKNRSLAYGRQLRAMIEDQRLLANRMVKLLERLEDEEDHRAIQEAKRRNGNRPLIPWAEAKKRLGLD
jgi:hypothetical protein